MDLYYLNKLLSHNDLDLEICKLFDEEHLKNIPVTLIHSVSDYELVSCPRFTTIATDQELESGPFANIKVVFKCPHNYYNDFSIEVYDEEGNTKRWNAQSRVHPTITYSEELGCDFLTFECLATEASKYIVQSYTWIDK